MTTAEQIKAIQDSYQQETGSRPSRAAAEVLLDQMAEARFQIAQVEDDEFDPIDDGGLHAEAAMDRFWEESGGFATADDYR